MAVDLCPCCDTWRFKRGPRGKVAMIDSSGASGATLKVYDLDGLFLWSADAIRHNAYNLQAAIGLCWGPGQQVYVTQRDATNAGNPAFPAKHCYLYQWDGGGTFVSDTTLDDEAVPARVRTLRANPAGEIVYAINASGGNGVQAKTISGLTLVSTGGGTFGAVSIDDDGYMYSLGTGEFGTAATVWRWDPDGTLVESYVPSGLTLGGTGAMDVAPDGTYCWAATSTFGGGTWNTVRKKLQIPGGSVLSTVSSSGSSATKINAISESRWGTRYEALAAGDTDSGQPDIEKVLVASNVLSRSYGLGGLTTVTLSAAPTTPIQHCAVSLD